MRIRFLQALELTVVTNLCGKEHKFQNKVFPDIDYRVTEINENNGHVDIVFNDGSVSYFVDKSLFNKVA